MSLNPSVFTTAQNIHSGQSMIKISLGKVTQGNQAVYDLGCHQIFNSFKVPFITGTIEGFTVIPEILIDAPKIKEGQLFSLTSFLSVFHQRARAVGE